MVTVKFYGYSDVPKFIERAKVDVLDKFQNVYPKSECEIQLNQEEEEFNFIFNGYWSSPDEVDEDIVKEICNNNELYCSICENGEPNKSYYYDEDDVFVYE